MPDLVRTDAVACPGKTLEKRPESSLGPIFGVPVGKSPKLLESLIQCPCNAPVKSARRELAQYEGAIIVPSNVSSPERQLEI